MVVGGLVAVLLALALALALPARAEDAKESTGAWSTTPPWRVQPFAQPVLGGFLFRSGGQTSSGLSIGAEAGLRYWQTHQAKPRLRGMTRAIGTYVLRTGDARGEEVRLGTFLGPTWDHFGLQTGPDGFWDRYQLGGASLDPTLGLAWPVTALAWTDAFSVYAGLEPAFLTNPDRRVDWSQQAVPGFGDELTYRAGLGFDVGGLGLSVGYTYRITAQGGQHGLSAGMSL